MKSKYAKNNAMHQQNDAFAKRVNAEQAKKAGKDPKLEEKYCNFNAEMMNNGEHAQKLARDLTRGLDKTAFPVD